MLTKMLSTESPSLETLAHFVYDQLPEAETELVEAYLAADPDHWDVVAGLLRIRQAENCADPEALLKAVREGAAALNLDRKVRPAGAPEAKVRSVRWPLSVAAGVLLLVGILGLWYWQSGTEERLAASLMEANRPDYLARTMSGTGTDQDREQHYLEVLEAGRTAEYGAGIAYFEGVAPGDAGYPASLANLGYFYFAAGQYSLAVKAFERYLAEADIPRRRRQRAEFDRALALIGAGRGAEGWAALRLIAADEAHHLRQRAQGIIVDYGK